MYIGRCAPALALLALGAASPAQWDLTNPKTASTVYQDQAGRFTLQVPPTWTPAASADSVVFKWSKSAVSVMPQSGAADLKAMSENAAARIRTVATQYKETSASDAPASSRAARSVEFTAVGPNGEPTRGRIVAITDAANGLVFILTCPPAEFAASSNSLSDVVSRAAFNNGAAAAKVIILSERTRVKVAILEGLTSDSAKKDAEVRYEVADDVLGPNREILIERGAVAYGSVLRAKHRGVFGKPGKLDINVEFTTAVDGTRVPLRSTSDMRASGKSNSGATAAVALIVSPLGLLINGRDVSVKKGTEFTVFIDKDVVIDPNKRAAAPKR
ncbi:MAG TPA: hypothetical protein VGM37_02295 [Armatimonadota bacterium]